MIKRNFWFWFHKQGSIKIKYTANVYRVIKGFLLQYLQGFPINRKYYRVFLADIAEKTLNHPVNPCIDIEMDSSYCWPNTKSKLYLIWGFLCSLACTSFSIWWGCIVKKRQVITFGSCASMLRNGWRSRFALLFRAGVRV